MHSLARLIEPGRKSPSASDKSSIRGARSVAHPEMTNRNLEIVKAFVVTRDWLSPGERGRPMLFMLHHL